MSDATHSPMSPVGRPAPPRPPAGETAAPSSAPRDFSLVSLLNVVLRGRDAFVAATALAIVVLLVLEVLRPPTYSSVSSFMAQSRRMPNGLAGFASQFGLALPGAEAGQSPAFYVELLKSREILGAAVTSTFVVPDTSPEIRADLMAIYGVQGTDSLQRRDRAIRRLARALELTAQQRTGLVEVRVGAPAPELARAINTRLLELVNRFNLESRQSQASAERRFTERRLEEVRAELRRAEDQARQFLQRNRDFANSPQLALEKDRLDREVFMRQEVYTTLAQAYEQAKIEEIRDTPVITVIQQPEAPVRPDSRRLFNKLVFALVAGGLVGLAVSFYQESQRLHRLEPGGEYAEFRALREAAMADLRRPWRPIRRLFSRRRM